MVQGGDPGCFDPVVVDGRVFDLADDTGIQDARVVALDANSAPVSSVATSGMDGSYELAIPTTRQSDGTPTGATITLRADAAGYQTFPSGLRQALPVDTSTATRSGDSGPWVVQSAATDIGLLALEAGAGTASIHGTVDVPDTHPGVLVVAETGGTGYSAIADKDGDYRIFNLPTGDYTVGAYAVGVNYDPASLSLASGDDTKVDLSINSTPATQLSGSVIINDPGLGNGTSVILVVKSTFNDKLARGNAVPGLRAPEPGTAPNITGDFTIDGVPDGDYVALAAFENDHLVRDPDTCQAQTSLVYVTVGGSTTQTIDQAFKVTGSLELTNPSTDGADAVASKPTLSWDKDPSAVQYDVTVVDAYGNNVWSKTLTSGGSAPPPTSVAYGGPLDAGMYYQVRVQSDRSDNATLCPISQTEDLKGVFYLQP